MSKWLVCLAVVALAPLVGGADDPADKRAERELARLDGTWQVVSIEHESVKAPEAQTEGATWTFAKGTLTTRAGGAGKGVDERADWKVRFEAGGKRKALALEGP